MGREKSRMESLVSQLTSQKFVTRSPVKEDVVEVPAKFGPQIKF
jgi:hypothetical protein